MADNEENQVESPADSGSDDAEFNEAFAEFSGDGEDEASDGAASDAGNGEEADANTDNDAGDGDKAGNGGEDGEKSPDSKESRSDKKTDEPAKKDGKTDKPDIWANATPEQRAELESIRRSERRTAGQVSVLQRRLNEIEAVGRQPAKQQDRGSDGAKTPPAAEVFNGPDWEDLKADYPEVAGSLQKVFEDQSSKLERLEKQVGGLGQAHSEEIYQANYERVLDAHGDYDEIRKSKDFGAWVKDQPRYILDGLKRNGNEVIDPEEVSHIISRYKQDTSATANTEPAPSKKGGDPEKLAAKREHQLESAASVDSTGTGTSSGPPDDFEASFNFYSEKKERKAAKA